MLSPPTRDPFIAGKLLPLSPYATTTKTITLGPSAIAAAASVDIINISPGRPGVLTRFQIGSGPGNTSSTAATNDDTINVYVDGEGSPSITMDVGSLGMHYTAQTTNGFDVRCKHLGAVLAGTNLTSGWANAVTLTLPMPFKTGIRISYTRKASNTNLDQFWSDASYMLGPYIPKRLKNACTTGVGATTLTSTQLNDNTYPSGGLTFLNLPSGAGNAGHIVLHTQCVFNASNFTWSETNAALYIDGNLPNAGGTQVPDWNTDGFEALFDSAWYFPGAAPYSSPGFMMTAKQGTGNTNGATLAVDLLELCGGLRFNDGCLFRWEGGDPATRWYSSGAGNATTGCKVAWNTFYYLDTP